MVELNKKYTKTLKIHINIKKAAGYINLDCIALRRSSLYRLLSSQRERDSASKQIFELCSLSFRSLIFKKVSSFTEEIIYKI